MISTERKMRVTLYLNSNLNRLTLCMKMQQGQSSGISFQFTAIMVRQSLQFLLKVLGGKADIYGCFIHQTAITSSFALPLRMPQGLTNHMGKPAIPDCSVLYDRACRWLSPEPPQDTLQTQHSTLTLTS